MDLERQTKIVDETKMRRKLRSLIQKAKSDIVVDGHFAAAVTPKNLVAHVFVLRRNPVELREFMQRCSFKQSKQDENLSAEILDVCLVEALHSQDKSRVCEIDVTSKTVEETLNEVTAILEGKRGCFSGCIDWISTLEREGKLGDYLKT
jgi:adenylate kinase